MRGASSGECCSLIQARMANYNTQAAFKVEVSLKDLNSVAVMQIYVTFTKFNRMGKSTLHDNTS